MTDNLPDPAWDYGKAWHQAQAAKQKLEQAIAVMSQPELQTEHHNQRIVDLLLRASEELSSAANMIDVNYP